MDRYMIPDMVEEQCRESSKLRSKIEAIMIGVNQVLWMVTPRVECGILEHLNLHL